MSGSAGAAGRILSFVRLFKFERPTRQFVIRKGVGVTVWYLGFCALGIWGATRGVPPPSAADAMLIAPTHEDVQFKSTDGLTLSGWLYTAPHPTGRSVILVHGQLAGRIDGNFVKDGQHFLQQGYAVLLFDMRGTESASGGRQTFATQEPRDLNGALAFMTSRGYDHHKMVILGDSMGASTVIEDTAALSDVAALICDSPFTAVDHAINYRVSEGTHLPSPLIWLPIQLSRVAGVDPTLRPIDVVAAHPERAYLFISSAKDAVVSPQDARDIYAVSGNPNSRLFIANNGAHHIDTLDPNPTAYFMAVDTFIESQIGN